MCFQPTRLLKKICDPKGLDIDMHSLEWTKDSMKRIGQSTEQ